jgi:hypothetical protein
MDAEVTEAEEASDPDGLPRFYPFPLRATNDSED